MSGVLPASPAARRAELEARERARTEAFDRGYAQGRAYGDSIMGKGAAAKPSSTPAPEDLAFETSLIADMLAAGTITIPGSLCFTSPPDGPPIVTTVTIPALGSMSVEDLVRTGLVTTRGLDRRVFAQMVEARPGRSGPWLNPLHPDSKPAYAPRVIHRD